jgi:hypothetical protein
MVFIKNAGSLILKTLCMVLQGRFIYWIEYVFKTVAVQSSDTATLISVSYLSLYFIWSVYVLFISYIL